MFRYIPAIAFHKIRDSLFPVPDDHILLPDQYRCKNFPHNGTQSGDRRPIQISIFDIQIFMPKKMMDTAHPRKAPYSSRICVNPFFCR